jgi:hypothetical protein
VRQSFQYKLFACKRLKHLHRTIDVSAEIWNHSVALHRRYYRLFKKTLPKAKLQAHLAKMRNGRRAHWKVVGSQSVQAITDRLYFGWEAFFRGDIKRPPTFRRRRKYRSFDLQVFDGFFRDRSLQAARAELDAASQQLEQTRDQAVREVWKSYTDLRTAIRSGAAAAALLKSSQGAYDSVLASFKLGFSTYTDVVTNETKLTSARTTPEAMREREIPTPWRPSRQSQAIPRTRRNYASVSRGLHVNRISQLYIQDAISGSHALLCFVYNKGGEGNYSHYCIVGSIRGYNSDRRCNLNL